MSTLKINSREVIKYMIYNLKFPTFFLLQAAAFLNSIHHIPVFTTLINHKEHKEELRKLFPFERIIIKIYAQKIAFEHASDWVFYIQPRFFIPLDLMNKENKINRLVIECCCRSFSEEDEEDLAAKILFFLRHFNRSLFN